VKGSKILLSLLALVSCSCAAMLEQQGQDYVFRDNQESHLVKRYDVHPFLRNLTPGQLRKYYEVGNRIKAIKLSNGDYIARPIGELNGGGPWLAGIVAAVGYPVVGVTALAATIASIPAAGPGCFLVGWGVAAAGTVAVTKGVIAAAVVPTP